MIGQNLLTVRKDTMSFGSLFDVMEKHYLFDGQAVDLRIEIQTATASNLLSLSLSML